MNLWKLLLGINLEKLPESKLGQDSVFVDCPATPGEIRRFNVTQSQTVSLARSDGLCTLSIQQNNSYIPVARSYEGHGWERAGGLFSSTLDEWSCQVRCAVALPPAEYTLERRNLMTDDKYKWVRFLESCTFGAQRGDLTSGKGSIRDIAEWIQNQIQVVQPTMHRQFYRHRLGPIWEFDQKEYVGRKNPCSVDSLWRDTWLSEKDVDKVIVVQDTASGRVVTVDGQIRSIVPQLRIASFLTGEVVRDFPAGSYDLCQNNDVVRRGFFRLRLLNQRRCLPVYPEDMRVQFLNDTAVPFLLSAGRLDEQWEALPVYGGESVPRIYRRRFPVSSGFCAGQSVSDPTELPPVFRSNNTDLPVVVARVATGEYLLWQPIADVRENTVESPIPDGGLDQMDRTGYCSNAFRNKWNEQGCIMSSGPACRAGTGETAVGTIVCGSQDEVSHNPSLVHSWLDIRSIPNDNSAAAAGLPKDTTSREEFSRQREFIWNEIALTAPDQLRQRVAWALFQIFSLPKSSVMNERQMTESFLVYYDILVRHAFGNYRDILQEMAYNTLNAESLSYLWSASTGLQYGTSGVLAYPDENFARELMQLWTIGTIELRDDGTPILDANGNVKQTYSSDDVANFARAWTGFGLAPKRSNTEFTGRTNSRVDPMVLIPIRRDLFPKADLTGGYIGDGYPLCADLKKSHLQIGAKYRLLGKQPIPEMVEDDKAWVLRPTTKRLVLDEQSPLYQRLCASNGSSCTFPSVVVLDSFIDCGRDSGEISAERIDNMFARTECEVETVRVVEVNGVYYEYIQPPCVNFAWFSDGQLVRNGRSSSNSEICADPDLMVASEACCVAGETIAQPMCSYAGERLSFLGAEERCSREGLTLCDFQNFRATAGCPHKIYHWTSETCRVQVKVDSNGFAAIVHDVSQPHWLVQEDTPSFFKVRWTGARYPSISNNCGSGRCRQLNGSCICDVSVVESPVFASKPSNASEILEKLSVGSTDPAVFKPGQMKVEEDTEFTIFSSGGLCCDSNTVFGVPVESGTKYLKNVLSEVIVEGTDYKFRNPPTFHSVVPGELSVSSVEYETEAVLDHFFYHQNTAPFVAYRLIQRFGFSNPSPRYVKTVALAFKTGSIEVNGIVFGTGNYGDLSATIAAILLDRESRSGALMSDPSHGALHEPILKVLRFMKAMEFESSLPLVDLNLMEAKIGQAPYEQPSVFNFYRPEYSPPGIASSAMLVAPESEVMSSGKVVGLLNGLFSFSEAGLVLCDHGFGSFGCPQNGTMAENVTSGQLTYRFDAKEDRAAAIKELSDLLTAGRMSTEKQALVTKAVSGLGDFEEAMKAASKYMLTTPEFHSSSSVYAGLHQSEDRQSAPENPSELKDDYKVVIHLALRGGCDSYNVLVPHSSCGTYASYKETRGHIALNATDMLPIESTGGQPCTRFGIHNKLPILQELYNAEELLFFANTGVLTQPVTQENYKELTATALFAHNFMQDEIDALDPFNTAAGTGSLGRMADVLQSKGYRVGRTAVESSPANLGGSGTSVSPIYTLDENGITRFDVDLSNPAAAEVIGELNGVGAAEHAGQKTGIHGEVWSSTLSRSLNQSDTLFYILQSSTETETTFSNSQMDKRFKLISQLIKTRKERKVDRDFFFVTMSGYDHHADLTAGLEDRFSLLNRAVTNLVSELKGQGVWDDVTIMQSSDFGRTLTPNSSGGSDHGWGGNYWMAGGSVKGGQIKGKYPDSFSDSAAENIGRGRLIPSTPFDSCFHGIANWAGIESSEEMMTQVLPNSNNFEELYEASDLFHST